MPNTTPNYSFFLPLVDDPTDQDLWGGYLNDNFSSLDTLLSSLTPSGVVSTTASSAAPTGWLLCYGQAISRSTYAALFTAIGTAYGTGDGSTTFNLPDARGRVIAGVDNMGGSAASRMTAGHSGITGTTLGAAGGNEQLHSHTHTASVTDPTHHHGWNATLSVNVNNNSMALGQGGGNGPITAATGNTTNVATGVTVTNSTAGGGASENVQPTIMMNIIIKI